MKVLFYIEYPFSGIKWIQQPILAKEQTISKEGQTDRDGRHYAVEGVHQELEAILMAYDMGRYVLHDCCWLIENM